MFSHYTEKKAACALTSVKTNLGHTFAASGLVSLITLISAMQQHIIPASLHYEQESDYIDWDNSNCYVNQQCRPWQASGNRIGAVSAFGMSGTNAHMVVEEAVNNVKATVLPTYLLVIAAKTTAALKARVTAYLSYLKARTLVPQEWTAFIYTLQAGRYHFPHRLACAVNDQKEAITLLANWLNDTGTTQIQTDVVQPDFRLSAALQQQVKELAADSNKLLNDPARYRHTLIALGAYYCQGANIPWEMLYNGQIPGRLSLPGYPFAQEHYWVTPAVAKITYIPPVNNTDPEDLLTFTEHWVTSPVNTQQTEQFATILCFTGNKQTTQTVTAYLKQHNTDTRVIFVEYDNSFRQINATHFTLNAQQPEDYSQLYNNISQLPGKTAIWYMANDQELKQEYHHIFCLLKSLATAALPPVEIILTARINTAIDRVYIDTWIGFERSLAFVLPGSRLRLIAFEAEEPNLIQKGWEELHLQTGQSIWYEKGKRKTRSVQPILLQPAENILVENGVYLITGGTGGLGALFARHLAGKYKATLLLTGRSALNSDRSAILKELQKLGANVHYIQADVCDETALRQVFQTALDTYGRIDGVIHAAGIAADTLLQHNEWPRFSNVLSPKITGTLLLDKILQETCTAHPPAFVCYFSSSSAIIGDFGSCDYAIGNRFQLSYGQYRSAQRYPGKTVVINWPLWKEGGMRFDQDASTQLYLRTSGQRLLHAAEGIALFEQLLAQPEGTYLVLAGQQERIHRFLGVTPATETTAPPALAPASNGTTIKSDKQNNSKRLETDIKGFISHQLKIDADKLDPRVNLADFGFDSIKLSALAKTLSNHFNTTITPAVFFGHASINALVTYFETNFATAITQLYQQNEQAPAITASPAASPSGAGELLHLTEGPIAIIGMSGRFPQSRNIAELWELLTGGINAVQEIPADRFDWKEYYGDPAQEEGRTNGKWCGTVPGAGEFDAAFFEFSPREATGMDPRQRLLLQEAWNTLEDAGYGPEQLTTQTIGMYVGVEEGDYALLAKGQGNITSSHNAILAARLAYHLGFNGPVMAINTACSSGLVAVHQACMSLWRNETDAAIAAGVNLLLTPDSFISMGQAGMLSPDGKSYAFDSRANGMTPGEAIAVVMLKRLADAERDGDPIYAVIKGSGVNYDGRSNGITAPNSTAQSSLMQNIYQRFEIAPQQIEYIVTHGTATRIGDPVEIQALDNVFRQHTDRKQYCALTSNKSNLGHTFAAAGIVNLINMVQAVKTGLIPASLHCEQDTDYINWKDSCFFVNKSTRTWDTANANGRLGAVSAFGMSGTNAHVVVQQYAAAAKAAAKLPAYLLLLSAKTESTLQQRISQLLAFLESPAADTAALAAIGHTLQTGRHHFRYRFAGVIHTREEAIATLRSSLSGDQHPQIFRGIVPPVFEEQEVLANYTKELLLQCRDRQDSTTYAEHLHGLATLYCQGYDINWSDLYDQLRPARIHLPTYPFERLVYWPVAKAEKVITPPEPLEPEQTSEPIAKPIAITLGQPVAITLEAEEKKINIATLPAMVPATTAVTPAETKAITATTAPRIQQLETALVNSLAAVLYLEPAEIDKTKTFIELGMDSIIGVEWIRTVNKKYATTLGATKVYDYPTIKEFAVFLQELLTPQQNDHTTVPASPDIAPIPVQQVLPPVKPARNINTLQNELIRTFADILYVEPGDIDPDKKFIEMGMDSIISVEWIRQLNKQYQTTISATKVYDYPTIRAFTTFLAEELDQRIQTTATDTSASLDDVLKQVEDGQLDIDQATQFLHQLKF
ncbi:hypothetical protein CK934_18925 [Chitinophaga sp. MD30]|nr:hypothetical protein CK934_18925 [Chitinophaga sp. MD30]